MNTCCGNNRQKPIITQAKNIIEGWSNLVTKKYKHTWWVKSRAEICARCVHLNKTTKLCKLCGCMIPAKITVKSESCPLKHWDKVK